MGGGDGDGGGDDARAGIPAGGVVWGLADAGCLPLRGKGGRDALGGNVPDFLLADVLRELVGRR